MNRSILVIDDDAEIIGIVATHLTPLGFAVEGASDGESGLEKALHGRYDMIILDNQMPGRSGTDVCRALRAQNGQQPILFLSGQSDVIDRVVGLEVGADDYLTKPFHVRELVARVEAILRRSARLTVESNMDEIITRRDLVIDRRRMTVERAGEKIDLSANEFRLLEYLALHPGRPMTRDQLRDAVWGMQCGQFDQTVTTALARLRAKIEVDPANPSFILTVRGIGYRFAES